MKETKENTLNCINTITYKTASTNFVEMKNENRMGNNLLGFFEKLQPIVSKFNVKNVSILQQLWDADLLHQNLDEKNALARNSRQNRNKHYYRQNETYLYNISVSILSISFEI